MSATASAWLSCRSQPACCAGPGGLTRPFGQATATVSPLRGGQRLGGAKHDAARTLLDDGGVLSARVLRPGVERRLPQRNRLGQCDARLGLIDGEGPAGAGGVPIELVVVGEEADLPRGAIGDDVFVPAGAEKPIGAADADPDAVAQPFRGPVFRAAVAGDGPDLEADLDARAVLARVGGRKSRKMPRRISLPSACTAIVSMTARSPLRSTVTSLTKRRMRSTAPAGPSAASSTTERQRNPSDRDHGLLPGNATWGAAASAAVLELEERLLLEAERARQQHIGERLDADVEVAHGAVVVAPRHLDLVLDVRKLVLQIEEILVGLELWISLRQRHQPTERARQRPLRRRLPADIAGGDAGGALPGHVLEQAALVRRIRLYGLDQVGDQVGAPAQLHVDAAPALAHDVALADEPVEDDDGVHQRRGRRRRRRSIPSRESCSVVDGKDPIARQACLGLNRADRTVGRMWDSRVPPAIGSTALPCPAILVYTAPARGAAASAPARRTRKCAPFFCARMSALVPDEWPNTAKSEPPCPLVNP